MSNLKTVGVVVDNYKLEKFKAELTKETFVKGIETKPFTADTTIIRAKVPPEKISEVHRICARLELGFKQQSN